MHRVYTIKRIGLIILIMTLNSLIFWSFQQSQEEIKLFWTSLIKESKQKWQYWNSLSLKHKNDIIN